MYMVNIYQTLEDRGNYEEVESHGPYFCSLYDKSGKQKSGTKEPWLGEGFYFWDTRIKDARWWGDTVYSWKGYIICQTSYDQHSPLLYDMVGSLDMLNDFDECARHIKERRKLKTVSFPVVLEYLKRKEDFNYKAIRVWPDPITKTQNNIGVYFPGNKTVLNMIEKVQICFFDNTLLTQPFTIVEKHPFSSSMYTI